MRMLIFTGNVLAAIAVALFLTCSKISGPDSVPAFNFSVIDVGEGLAQFGWSGALGVAFDVGDSSGHAAWTSAYARAGSPFIQAIVVSHSHIDHCGGLRLLPREIGFSGLIVTHAREDTAYIRKIAGAWHDAVRFRLVSQGDTLACLDGVTITCLWPPASIPAPAPLADSLKNTYSLCFSLRCRDNSVLITSDVDTFSLRQLCAAYGFGLAHDVVVAPHHGSAGSIDPVFYGYVNPSSAVISCGVGNPYGHPSSKLLDLLFQMRVDCRITATAGTVTLRGNGYYWTGDAGPE